MLVRWVAQIVALIYVAVIYPVNEGFSITPTVGSAAFVCDIVIDVWFLIDIWLNFRTAIKYDDDDENRRDMLEIDPSKVAKRYLKGWFLIDFVSCLPVNYVTYPAGLHLPVCPKTTVSVFPVSLVLCCIDGIQENASVVTRG